MTASKGGASAPPSTSRDAASRLSDLEAIQSSKYRDKTSPIPNLEYVHPDILRFYRGLNTELKSRNYPFYAFEFYRSPERQRLLLRKGTTKASAGKSPHQFGCAVDIIHLNRLWDLTRQEWSLVGLLGKDVARRLHLKMVWGGDWGFWDPAHWELESWRDCRHIWNAIRAAERTGTALSPEHATNPYYSHASVLPGRL